MNTFETDFTSNRIKKLNIFKSLQDNQGFSMHKSDKKHS